MNQETNETKVGGTPQQPPRNNGHVYEPTQMMQSRPRQSNAGKIIVFILVLIILGLCVAIFFTKCDSKGDPAAPIAPADSVTNVTDGKDTLTERRISRPDLTPAAPAAAPAPAATAAAPAKAVPAARPAARPATPATAPGTTTGTTTGAATRARTTGNDMSPSTGSTSSSSSRSLAPSSSSSGGGRIDSK